jgi:hypothetical protein
MALNRPLLAVAGGALVIILASLGGLAFFLLRTGPVAQRLVREAQDLERATHPRPAHVPSPGPGTFAQAVQPHLDALVSAYGTKPQLTGDLAQRCREVADGKVAPEALAPECRQVLERDRALMRHVLAATHVQEGGLPEGLDVLSDPNHPYQRHGLPVLLHPVRLAAMEMRLLLAAGQAEQAVDLCLDALAFSREAGLGGGLIGRMLSSGGYDIAWRPCAAALDAAPVARKRRAVDQLARLREGLAPYSQTLREESLFLQLGVHAPLFLSEEERRALPPRAARLTRTGPGATMATADGTALLMRADWLNTVEVFDLLMPAADLPAAARRMAFTTLDGPQSRVFWVQRQLQSLTFVQTMDERGFQRFAERIERQRLQSDALALLAELDARRAEQGHWPPALLAVAANDFTLATPTPGEARITARDVVFPELVLDFTADAPAAAPVELKAVKHVP